MDGFRIFNGLIFIGTGSVLIRSDPEPDPDPYPFQPNVKLNYKFFHKIPKYFILKIMTHMTLTRRIKQRKLSLI